MLGIEHHEIGIRIPHFRRCIEVDPPFRGTALDTDEELMLLIVLAAVACVLDSQVVRRAHNRVHRLNQALYLRWDKSVIRMWFQVHVHCVVELVETGILKIVMELRPVDLPLEAPSTGVYAVNVPFHVTDDHFQ